VVPGREVCGTEASELGRNGEGHSPSHRYTVPDEAIRLDKLRQTAERKRGSNMIAVKELKRWLDTLEPDAEVGIDEGGLILYTEEMDACIEIGGLPDDAEVQS
jgi:hypothetical protein